MVINFLNRKNAADVRVYELLDQKFRLFDGLFGSSDEVLGSIESGMDFEKRIADIYQRCKTTEEIQAKFDQLQEELSERINEKMTAARQSILENFDEEVAARLKGCHQDTLAGLDKFSQWLYHFFIAQGADRVEPLDQYRLHYRENGTGENYNLKWQDAEKQGDIFLRRDIPLCREWLGQAMSVPVPAAKLRFDYTNAGRNIGFLTAHPRLCGTFSVDKLIYSGIETEEHLIFSVVTEDGTEVDDDILNRIMELPATIIETCSPEIAELEGRRRDGIIKRQTQIEENNKKYFLEECDKLDAYSEDLKEGLQRELKELKKLVTEKKKTLRANKDTSTLEEMLTMKDEINRLDERRKKMQRDIYDEEDRIEAENERLQEDIRAKLAGTSRTEHIITVSFEIA